MVEDLVLIGHAVNQLAEMAHLVANSVQDLAAYVHLAEVLALTDDFLALSADLEAVGGRMDGRNTWWRNAQVPRTVGDLAGFSLGASGQCFTTYHDAYGLQGLLRRLTGLMRRITLIMSKLGSLTGSVASLQVLNGHVAKMGASVDTLAGMMAGINEAKLCEALQQNIERQSMEWIGQDMLRDWGAYTPFP